MGYFMGFCMFSFSNKSKKGFPYWLLNKWSPGVCVCMLCTYPHCAQLNRGRDVKHTRSTVRLAWLCGGEVAVQRLLNGDCLRSTARVPKLVPSVKASAVGANGVAEITDREDLTVVLLTSCVRWRATWILVRKRSKSTSGM